IPKEIPTVRLLVPGLADVLSGSGCSPRKSAHQKNRRINPPPFEQLAITLLSGEVVVERQTKVMPVVEIGRAVIQVRVQVVHRNLLVAIYRGIVQGMAEGISRHKTESVIVTRGQRRLQRVVIGRVDVRQDVNKLQVGELRIIRAMRLA